MQNYEANADESATIKIQTHADNDIFLWRNINISIYISDFFNLKNTN